MSKNWKIMLGVLVVVCLLKILLIPDTFRLGLVIPQFHYKGSDPSPTHVLIESDIWQSSILVINSGDYTNFRTKDIDLSKKKALSLFKANQVYRLTKSLSQQYQEGKLKAFCCTSKFSLLEGKFMYGNSVIENFTLDVSCSEPAEEYGEFLLNLAKEELAKR